MKTSICHISTVHNIYDTRIFYRELHSLVESGYDVNYVVTHDKCEVIDGINIISLKKSRNKIFRVLFKPLQAFIKAHKTKAKIIHFHDPELIFLGYILALLGRNVIFDIHENIPLQLETKDWLIFNKTISKVYNLVEKMMCKKFYLILAEDSYEKYYKNGKKIITLRNVPDIRLLGEIKRKEKNKLKLGYVGSVTEIRGISTVLEVVKRFHDENIKLYFECVGPMREDYKLKLDNYVKENNLSEYVKFYGRVKFKEAYETISDCKLGVALLKPVPNYVESMPTKLYEYMYMSIPYITSNFPLYKRFTDESKAGICVDPENIDEIYNSIKNIILNDGLLKQMTKNGKNIIESKYNWVIEREKLYDLYNDIINIL